MVCDTIEITIAHQNCPDGQAQGQLWRCADLSAQLALQKLRAGTELMQA